MNQRLGKLCFVPPAACTPWTGPPKEPVPTRIQRADGVSVQLDLPLFWHDPPWDLIRTDSADLIATAVAELGVAVSALRSDLSTPEAEPVFHQADAAEENDSGSDLDSPRGGELDSESADRVFLPRIVPYRPERYGLSDRDFDGAKVVDVRLMMNRDSTGRFAFSPQQIERWESTPSSDPVAGGGWVPAASFPPDVGSFEQLANKFTQLRCLAAEAAVLVTLGPHNLETELPQVLKNQPDGIILRLDSLDLSGLELASVVRHTRQQMDRHGTNDMSLWIVPGQVTSEDAVKLISLGACAVAIDAWCEELIDTAIAGQQSSSLSRLGYPLLSGGNDSALLSWIDDELTPQVERVTGLLHSMEYVPANRRLASLSREWAELLDVPSLAPPFVSD